MKKLYQLAGLLLLCILLPTQLFSQKTITLKRMLEINIDGNGDEAGWTNAQEHAITNFLQSPPQDEFDFLSVFKVAWNDTAVFYFVETQDFDVYPTDSWASDHMEWYFKFGAGSIEGNDIGEDQVNGVFQIAVNTNNAPATGNYMPDSTKNDDYTIITDLGWRTEGYISWSQFNDENENAITPTNGYTFRFDCNVQDNDLPPDDADYYTKGVGFMRNYWSSTTHLWDGDFSDAGIASLSNELLAPTTVKLNILSGNMIYPNPASDLIYFHGKADFVQIYSLLGDLMFSSHLNSNKSLNVSELSKGIYFIKFYGSGKFINAHKLLIE